MDDEDDNDGGGGDDEDGDLTYLKGHILNFIRLKINGSSPC